MLSLWSAVLVISGLQIETKNNTTIQAENTFDSNESINLEIKATESAQIALQTPINTVRFIQAPSLPKNPKYAFPLSSHKKLTSTFSKHHPGIDISAKYGTPVYAVTGGKVVSAGWSSQGFGKEIIIESENYWQRYAHLSSININSGSNISSGQQIGTVGCTGRCTGPHLHLEIARHGSFINPLSLF